MGTEIRLSNRDEELNYIVRGMAKLIDFKSSGVNQVIRHYWKAEKSEVKIHFLRQDRHMLFSFEGFGDLMGYVLMVTNAEESVVPAPIGLNGDVTLYISYMLPKRVRIGLLPPHFNSR